MLSEAQKAEIDKYEVAYRAPNYRMSEHRAGAVRKTLEELPWRWSYLDVSCGRGEMLSYAESIGFSHVMGTEIVPDLIGGNVVEALAWALPFPNVSFEVVSMFDVVEHLLPGDDERACRELSRVASKTVIITANNLTSLHEGMELHVNRRPYEEWDRLFRLWFPGNVTWLKHRRAKHSELWRIDLVEP